MGTPCQTSTGAVTTARGSSTQSSARVTSTQKLPSSGVRCRARPRMNAMPAARPAAPARKFWDVRPTTWLR
jgi:hypothetical protein